MVDTPQKRDRNRKRVLKRQEKELRRKERSEQKLERKSAPELGSIATNLDPTIVDSSTDESTSASVRLPT